MPRADLPSDHLTAYERAVCYYTLPRISPPITYDIIIAYAFCLFESLLAIAIGVFTDHRIWMKAGLIAFFSLILFGLLIFFYRAFRSDFRRRKALKEAANVPDAAEEDEALPDPFAGHKLLKRPIDAWHQLYACTEDDATIDYFVENIVKNALWNIRTAEDEEVCSVKGERSVQSFAFGADLPSVLGVFDGEKEIARITRKVSLRDPRLEIACYIPDERRYIIRNKGIYYKDRLVGRIYPLRKSYYLDIEDKHCHTAILAHFVTTTE